MPGLRRFVEWQITEGIHGLIPLGSTGKFLSLSDEEHEAVARTVIEQAAGRVPVVVGTGAEDTREAVRLSRRAQRLGADGVMIIPPFYCTPTEDEIYHHYKTIGDAIGLPIMVYNNPATANVDLVPPLLWLGFRQSRTAATSRNRLSTSRGCVTSSTFANDG